MKEADLCAEAVAWLRSEGWDVHQEVASPGGLIDILAVGPDSKRLWAIEAKLGFGLEVLSQALERKRAVHRVSILLPQRTTYLGRHVAEQLGVGVIERMQERGGTDRPGFHIAVDAPTALGKNFHPRWYYGDPERHRRDRAKSITNTRRFLSDETRNFTTAGHASPSYWSPFKELQRQLPKVLREKGPLTTRGLFEALSTSSGRPQTISGLYTFLTRGLFPGVVCVGGRPMKWGKAEKA